MATFGPIKDHRVIRAWAEHRNSEPVEVLPSIVDGVPPTLRLMPIGTAKKKYMRPLLWVDFFARFDIQGLSFVASDDDSGRYELVKVEPELEQITN